jgi:uncharacterized membrane protein
MEWTLSSIVTEIFYVLIGVLFILTGWKALRDKINPSRHFTACFWFVLAITFIAGKHIPYWVTGICVIFMGVCTALKKIQPSKSETCSEEETKTLAAKFGYKVFIPTVVLALTSVLIAIFWTSIGAQNAIGIASVLAVLAALTIFKAPVVQVAHEGTRLVDSVGVFGILPQVLAALGALFTAAGVGNVIAGGISHFLPQGNTLLAVIVYCVAMAVFTIVMGNAFAAFAVITVGIGVPFLINQRADPAIVGALGLLSGYCGTLLTPMAANFNILPVALLEIKNKYAVIKAQAPMSLALLILLITIMYFIGFSVDA